MSPTTVVTPGIWANPQVADLVSGTTPYPAPATASGVWHRGGGRGSVWRSADYGLTRPTVFVRDPTAYGRLVVFDDSSALLSSGRPGDVGGRNAIQNSAVWMTRDGGSLIYADGIDQWLSADQGSTWQLVARLSDSTLPTIAGVSGVTAFARGSNGGISWQPQGGQAQAPLAAMFFLDATRGWALDKGGRPLASVDGGGTWAFLSNVSLPGVGSLCTNKLRFLNTVDGVVLSSARAVASVTRDVGRTWYDRTVGAQADYGVPLALEQSDTRTIWAIGSGDRIAATRDGGRTWQPQASGTTSDLIDLGFADDRTAWVATPSGVLVATGTGGYWAQRCMTGQDQVDIRGQPAADTAVALKR